MIPKRNFQFESGKKSYLIALIFILIAVMGLMTMLSSIQGISKSDKVERHILEKQKVESSQKSSYTGFVLRIVLITVALIILTFLGAKWYRNRSRSDISDKMRMDIIGRRYIDSKHSLLMVRVNGRKILLGITDNSINRIAEYEENNTDENFAQAEITQMSDQSPKILKRFKVKSEDK